MSQPGPSPDSSQSRWFVGALVVVVVALAAVAGGLWWLDRGDGSAGERASQGAADSDPDRDGRSDRRDRRNDDERTDRDRDDRDRDLGDRAEDAADDKNAGDENAGGVPEDRRVVVVSIDGLASWAVSQEATPYLASLLAEGAGTLDARTEVEQTVTLPNHTSMVTGERIDAAAGGHGVTWNEDSSRVVAPGVTSVFSVIAAAGGESAVYAGKTKFEVWQRSWPGTIDEFEVREDERALTSAVVDDLTSDDRDLTFLHLRGPDVAGHAHTWGSPAYDAAVTASDAALGQVVDAISSDPDLADEIVLVVTADHGGLPGQARHDVAGNPADFTIPFVVWGAGIADGDLYDLNPDYADPGDAQPSYDGPQPVRNGDVANLVTDLLGLGPVPGSELDADHSLTVDSR